MAIIVNPTAAEFKQMLAEKKTFLADFYATWCGPCREELSRVQKDIIDRFKGNEDFVFLPVSRGETRETVAAFREKMGYTFPNGYNHYSRSVLYQERRGCFALRRLSAEGTPAGKTGKAVGQRTAGGAGSR